MKQPFRFHRISQRIRRLAVFSFPALGLGTLSLLFLPGRALTKSEPSPVTKAHIAEAYGQLPLMFQANAGQTDTRVKFTARGAGYSLFLTSTESVFVMSRRESESKESRWNGSDAERAAKAMRPAQQSVLRMKLAGANP